MSSKRKNKMGQYQVSVDIILKLLNDDKVKSRIKEITGSTQELASSMKTADKSLNQTELNMKKLGKEIENTNIKTKKALNTWTTTNTIIGKNEKALKRTQVMYKEVGGQVQRFTRTQEYHNGKWAAHESQINRVLSELTRYRWFLVNVTMGYMLLTRAIGPIIKAQIELETEMANVQRTTGYSAIKIKEMRHEFVKMSQDVPVAAKELAKIGAIGGQLGLGSQGPEAMTSFVRASSLLATATSMDAETAATNLAKISQSFNLHISNAMNLGAVLNELENTTAATAEEIAEALKRVGAAGENLDMPVEYVAALEATLISAGMKSSRAGTRIRNALNMISSNTEEVAKIAGVSFEEYNKLLRENSTEAFTLLIKKIAESEDQIKTSSQVMQTFGRVGGFAIQTLANNWSQLSDNIETATNEMNAGLSLIVESGTMMQTTAGQWQLLKNYIASATIESGGNINKLIQIIRSYQIIQEKTGQSVFRQLAGDIPAALVHMSTFGVLYEEITGKTIGKKRGKQEAIYKEQIEELKKLGKQAGLTNESFNNLWSDLEKFSSQSIVLASTQADNYIQGLKNMVIAQEEQSAVMTIAQEKFNGFSDALNKYIVANNAVEEATSGTLDDYMDSSMALEELKEDIEAAFGQDALRMIISYANGINKVNGATSQLSTTQKQASLIYSVVNNNLKKQIEEQQEEYNKLKRLRFVGEKEALDNIHRIEIALKEQRLAQLRLGDAVDSTNDSLSGQQDAYDAWVDTVNQFISSAIENGNLLGKNTTVAVSRFQSMLLNTRRASIDSIDKEAAKEGELEKQREIAQLEYELQYGEQRYQVEQYISEVERRGETEYRTAADAINAYISVQSELSNLKSKQEEITSEWEKATTQLNFFEAGIADAFDSINENVDEGIKKLREYINLMEEARIEVEIEPPDAIQQTQSTSPKSSFPTGYKTLAESYNAGVASALFSSKNNTDSNLGMSTMYPEYSISQAQPTSQMTSSFTIGSININGTYDNPIDGANILMKKLRDEMLTK